MLRAQSPATVRSKRCEVSMRGHSRKEITPEPCKRQKCGRPTTQGSYGRMTPRHVRSSWGTPGCLFLPSLLSSAGASHWLHCRHSICPGGPDGPVCRLQAPQSQNTTQEEREWIRNSKQNNQLPHVDSFTQTAFK